MKRLDWVVSCAVVVCTLSDLPRNATAQFGGGGKGGSAGEPATEPTAVADANDFCRCVGEASGGSVDKINKALDGPVISAGMEFAGIALGEVISTLQDDYNIPIQLDVTALDNMGLGPDEPVTISLQNISLRSALRLMLQRLQLTYVIYNEVLIITSPEDAEALLVVCVYDIRDLRGKNQPGSPPLQPQGASAWADYDALVGMITSCVSTETWAENGGGEAEIRSLKPGLLVISQTQAVHEEIRSLLAAIRSTLAETADETNAATMTPAADSNAIVTRHYLLPFGEGATIEANQLRILELITRLTPNAAWDAPLADGQAPILTALPDRLVVRHKESVQGEVQAALQDIGLVSPWQGASPGQAVGAGGFGGGGMFQTPPESE